VQIRHVRMMVCRRYVLVRVAMRAAGQRIVCVVMVPVVVRVRVFVFDRCVAMSMRVLLRQMEDHAG